MEMPQYEIADGQKVQLVSPAGTDCFEINFGELKRYFPESILKNIYSGDDETFIYLENLIEDDSSNFAKFLKDFSEIESISGIDSPTKAELEETLQELDTLERNYAGKNIPADEFKRTIYSDSSKDFTTAELALQKVEALERVLNTYNSKPEFLRGCKATMEGWNIIDRADVYIRSVLELISSVIHFQSRMQHRINEQNEKRIKKLEGGREF